MKRFFYFVGLLFLAAYSVQAQFNITGTITNEQGETLPGAAVYITELSNGTAADANGNYQIDRLKKGSYHLVFSFIGYKTTEKTVLLSADSKIDVQLPVQAVLGDEVIIRAYRAPDKAPIAYSNVSKEDLSRRNNGQDLPFLLQMTPSIVVTSDAGAGIGYTGLRIRGTDANRINIMLNGIPVNDAESHGVWFVNMPDLTSSVQNIQIQRGVGTSSNGAGAFGATINMQTLGLNEKPYARINSFAGSFNTFRNSAEFGTGLINNHFTFDGRVSKIKSDGFIDRASSDLQSLYLSAGYHSAKNILSFSIIHGEEKTYQAWNGIPKVRLDNDVDGMLQYAEDNGLDAEDTELLLTSNSHTYNPFTYKNQTDNYKQTHYQLHFSHKINSKLHFNTALHYTQGYGYYEEFRKNDKFEKYGLPNILVGSDATDFDPDYLDGNEVVSTDLIRRKYLDNDFFGNITSLSYTNDRIKVDVGASWNQYLGNHFGNIIWSRYWASNSYNYQWYENTGDKTDCNVFAKFNGQITSKLSVFADLQYRYIHHAINGIGKYGDTITQSHTFDFFNPKGGFHYQFNKFHSAYASVSVANREPNRDNFIDAPANRKPKAETLIDYEAGYKFINKLWTAEANLYFMQYRDQLVQTGRINDTGDKILENVSNSYRTGIELSAGIKPVHWFEWYINATISQNRIKQYTDYTDNWDNWETGEQDSIVLKNTSISFSPNLIASSQIVVRPIKQLQTILQTKYVGEQFLDNTSSDKYKLDSYLVTDFMVKYQMYMINDTKLSLSGQINNIFNTFYITNAWIYRYIYNDNQRVIDGYFPQAGTNFMVGLTLDF